MSTRYLKRFPLSLYKPTRTTFIHKIPRDDLKNDPKVRFPIYNRLPSFWREEFETPNPNVHQTLEKPGTARPQHSGLWKMGEKGPVRVQNAEIPLKFCEEAEQGIWGGETIIRAFRYPKNGKKR